MCLDVIYEGVTHVTFITQERACLSWRVSPESLHNVSSLSSTSVMVQGSEEVDLPGGGHVIPQR